MSIRMGGPGVRELRTRIGRRTAWDDGLGKIGMDGRGSATILGAGRRITMDAGSMSLALAGAGIPARLDPAIIGRPRWWRFSDSAGAVVLASALATSAGYRWRRMSRSIAGGAAAITAAVAS